MNEEPAPQSQPNFPCFLPWEKCMFGCKVYPNSEVTLLPCFHCLCSEACLVKWAAMRDSDSSSSQICSICHTTIIDTEILRNVIPNDLFKKTPTLQDARNEMKCGICVLEHQASTYCLQCEVYLCGNCTELHPNMKLSHSHQLDSNLEEREKIELEKLKEAQGICQVHKKRFLMLCSNCLNKLCEDCAAAHDARHHHLSLISEEMLRKDKQFKTARKLSKEAKHFMKILKEKSKRIANTESEVVDMIDAETNRIINLVKERGAFLKHDAKQKTKDKLELIKQMETRLKEEIRPVTHLKTTWRKVTLEFNEFGALNFAKLSAPLMDQVKEKVVNLKETVNQLLAENGSRLLLQTGGDLQLPESIMGLVSIECESSLVLAEINCSKEIETEGGRDKKRESGCSLEFERMEVRNSEEIKEPEDNLNNDDFNEGMHVSEVLNDSAFNEAGDEDEDMNELRQDFETAETGHGGTSNATKPEATNISSRSTTAHPTRKRSRNILSLEEVKVEVVELEPKRQKLQDHPSQLQVEGNFGASVSAVINGATPLGSSQMGGDGGFDPSIYDAGTLDFDKPPKKKGHETSSEEETCCICNERERNSDIFIVCDTCGLTFHWFCHIPDLHDDADYDEEGKWSCNLHKADELLKLEDIKNGNGEDLPLKPDNPKQFLLACKFLMQVHNMEEIDVIKYGFPEAYLKKYKIVPYHLKFIRYKLCLYHYYVNDETGPFVNVYDFLMAFKQIFKQAEVICKDMYKKRMAFPKCYANFKELVKIYYPNYQGIFNDEER